MRCLFCSGFLLLTAATPARAAPPDDSVIRPALTVGVLEVATLSPATGHLGVYVTTSLDVSVVLSPDWTVIPSFGFEFSPELGAWGGTFFFIVDYFLGEWAGLGWAIEPQLGVIHDAFPLENDDVDHALFASGGLGLAIVARRFVWIPQVIVSYGLDGEGWSLSPSLLFSVPF